MDLKKYKIDIFNLPVGRHEYEFEFKSDFFKKFENSLIDTGNGTVKVILNKSDTFLDLGFEIEGTIELICDRCLDVFDYPLEIKRNLIIKFGEEVETEDDEILFVPMGAQSIYLGQHIYEYISLEIPMKKLHPRFKDDFDKDQEEKLIYESGSDINVSEEETIDPRWQKLKELKKINKK